MGTSRARERWQVWIAKHASSALSIAEFCRRHGLALASFYHWRRKLREAEQTPASFIPLAITRPASTTVRIELPCGAVLHVPADDTRVLPQVLELLLQCPSSESPR